MSIALSALVVDLQRRLEVLERTHHPVSFVTKGTLILRDLDLLRSMAAQQLVQVFVSVTTLDAELKRTMEPRAASPQARPQPDLAPAPRSLSLRSQE